MKEKSPHVCFVSPYAYSYISPGSSKKTGGAERQQYLIARELIDNGYKVSFLVFEQAGSEYENIDELNIWKKIPQVHYNERSALMKAPIVLLKIALALRRVDADVYYSRGNPPLTGIVSWLCDVFNKPVITAIANDADIEKKHLEKYNKLIRKVFITSLQRSDITISQTSYQKNQLQTCYGITSIIVPNSYTVPDKEELIPMSERKYVLWVGSLDPQQKKPRRFLDLARALPMVEFVMIGSPLDPDYFKKIESCAAGIPNLTFEGFVQPDEIHEYYRNAIALVNTSDYEGFPNVFLEAWRYATPIISLHHSLDGILTKEIAGLYSGEMGTLIKDVKYLYDNRSKAAALGWNGRERMIEKHSVENNINIYTEMIDNITNLK